MDEREKESVLKALRWHSEITAELLRALIQDGRLTLAEAEARLDALRPGDLMPADEAAARNGWANIIMQRLREASVRH